METALKEIVDAIVAGNDELDDAWLDKLVRRRNREMHDGTRRVAKKRLLPHYLSMKANEPETLAAWGVDDAVDERIVRLLRAKPRRTASGVATVTVITKPHPCSSDCLYCPNDVRMPKSYLANEPACQRAERNFFDPYLQVRARLHTLQAMGHVTDKVELIVLGGTWSDYSRDYQVWFVRELFRALNEADTDAAGEARAQRERFYLDCGLTYDPEKLACRTAGAQRAVNARERSYNDVVREMYREGAWAVASAAQCATFEQLEREHRANEGAAHRVVGLVIETRPDLISADALSLMRRLGCTKVQMGIQSLNPAVLEANERRTSPEQVARAFSLLRLFGFKIHIHFMVNLLGATPEGDKADYLRLVTDPAFLPDEVKLYPCCLVESARLVERHAKGAWVPYAEGNLVDVLVADTLATPCYTRISRMIRDISSTDIIAGNKKTNLRQMVEARLDAEGARVSEIRQREISTTDVAFEDLSLDCAVYETSVSQERFLQWVTAEGKIAGFLRLSLPHESAVRTAQKAGGFPLDAGEAMIREVHVYGKVARLHEAGEGAQHLGLGRRLIEEACAQARAAGYGAVNVISSVGTRKYYRSQKFDDNGLYQRRSLA